MTTLLKPAVGPAEEAIEEQSSALGEAIAEPPAAARSALRTASLRSFRRRELLDAAHQVAEDLSRAESFYERLAVYSRVGRIFTSEARLVLNLAAINWPEMIPWINDEPEWKARLSADLS